LRAANDGLALDAENSFLRAKTITCRYYLEVMVPEAMALKGSAMAGSELLYALNAAELAG
jgi:hypothetical protein